MRLRVPVLCGWILLAPLSCAKPSPLGVADMVETSRFIKSDRQAEASNAEGVVSLSPSKRFYVVRIIRGDLIRNEVAMEIMGGEVESDFAPVLLVRLCSSGLGDGYNAFGSVDDVSDSNRIHWIDENRFAFLWTNERGVRQIMEVNRTTKAKRFVTDHPTHIVAFAVTPRGQVLFTAQAPAKPEPSSREGLVVDEWTDPLSLFLRRPGTGSLYDHAWNTQWFLASSVGQPPRPLRLGGASVDLSPMHTLETSSDGEWAIVSAVARELPEEWSQYTAPLLLRWIHDARRNNRGFAARSIHQLYLIKLGTGEWRPLWNAPAIAHTTKLAWSPDGEHVILAATAVPTAEANAAGLHAESVVAVHIRTGAFTVLPLRIARNNVAGVRWVSESEVCVVDQSSKTPIAQYFCLREGGWQKSQSSDLGSIATRFELCQALTSPPKLVLRRADGGGGRVLLTPNAALTDAFRLGRVEQISGPLGQDANWSGLLFYPVDYEQGRQYPLVIQSIYGKPHAISDEFTLYGVQNGSGLGPSIIAAYPGQALASRNIFVLHLTVQAPAFSASPKQPRLRQLAFEAAAEYLSTVGLVNRMKVGIVGFSRNGYWVDYTITHSAFPFAAALAADNFDASYTAATLTDYNAASEVNGAKPFGEGLQAWVENAPGFNAERVETPLLMIEQHLGLFGVIVRWEMFSRLRLLGKPVEFYVMPDYEHGSHSSQNPRQIVSVMQRSLDWFDFWLNDVERSTLVFPWETGEGLATQYEAWRRFRVRRSPH